MTDDIDTLIARTLREEDRALLERAGAEPGLALFLASACFARRSVVLLSRASASGGCTSPRVPQL